MPPSNIELDNNSGVVVGASPDWVYQGTTTIATGTSGNYLVADAISSGNTVTLQYPPSSPYEEPEVELTVEEWLDAELERMMVHL